MSATISGIATLCKYSSDFLKLRKDKKGSEKTEAIRDYIETCRRLDHNETISRLGLFDEKLHGFGELLAALWDLSEEQGKQLISTIESGNLSTLFAIKTGDKLTHAKLDQIIHLLDVQPRQLFSANPISWHNTQCKNYESRYLNLALSEFGRLEMLGVPGTRDFHQDLDIAYVNLELSAEVENRTIQPGRVEELLTRYRQLTIRGPAGSGKTTLLRWVGLQCALAADKPESPWHSGVPIYVPLRKLKGEDRGRPQEKRLHEYAFDAGLFEHAPNGWLQSIFDEGRAILLLDGLDELPGSVRPNFWKWLRKLLLQKPRIRVFVTSRPLSAEDNDDSPEWQPPTGFNHAELQDLSPEDQAVFIRKWHDAVMTVLTDSQTQLAQSREQLLEKLSLPSNSRVRELCKNPLTAGLVCALYWRELKLPETRRELYETSCNLLMVIRDEHRNITSDDPFMSVEKSDRFYLAECLAWEMMLNARVDKGQNIEASEKNARIWLKHYLPNCKDPELRKASPKLVLEFLIQRSGLLRVPSKGHIDFHHRSFQEYLAACAAAVLNQVVNLASKALDDQWRETIILAANTHEGGVTFGRALIDELLLEATRAKDETRARVCIATAAACLENCEKPLAGLRTEVARRLRQITPPRSILEAAAVAVGGEAVLPYLEYKSLKSRDRKTQKVLVASAAAISMIGSETSQRMLLDELGYGSINNSQLWHYTCNCPGIEPLDIPSVLAELQAAGTLTLSLWRKTTKLNALTKIKDTPYINIQNASVRDFSPISNLICLEKLTLLDNEHLADISFTASLANLTELVIQRSDHLSDLTPLSNLVNLSELNLWGCTSISDISAIRSLKNISRLCLTQCYNVVDLSPILALSRLETLVVVRCPQLQSSPILAQLKSRGIEVRGPG